MIPRLVDVHDLPDDYVAHMGFCKASLKSECLDELWLDGKSSGLVDVTILCDEFLFSGLGH
jgi:hypothetical protein